MGYIKLNIEAYLTQKGRESLISGKGTGITKFLVGDNDINYNLNEINTLISDKTITDKEFDICDISGEDDCVKSLSSSYIPKYFVWAGEKTVPFLNLYINNTTDFVDRIYTNNGSSALTIQVKLDDVTYEDCFVNIKLLENSDNLFRNVTYQNETYTPIDKVIFINVKIPKYSSESDTLTLTFREIPVANPVNVIDLDITLSGITNNFLIQGIDNNFEDEVIDPNLSNIVVEGGNVINDITQLIPPTILDYYVKILREGEVSKPISFTIINSNSSFNQADGTISLLNINGGIPPYRYDIFNSNNVVIRSDQLITNTNETLISNLGADTYTVYLKDNYNNITTGTTQIVGQGSQIVSEFEVVRNAYTFYPNSGVFKINTISGGNGIYNISIDNLGRVVNPFSTYLSITTLPLKIYDIPDGSYNYSVRDSSGLTKLYNFSIGTTSNYPNIKITYINGARRKFLFENVIKINEDINGKHTLRVEAIYPGGRIDSTINLPYFEGSYTLDDDKLQKENIPQGVRVSLTFYEYLTNRTSFETITT